MIAVSRWKEYPQREVRMAMLAILVAVLLLTGCSPRPQPTAPPPTAPLDVTPLHDNSSKAVVVPLGNIEPTATTPDYVPVRVE